MNADNELWENCPRCGYDRFYIVIEDGVIYMDCKRCDMEFQGKVQDIRAVKGGGRGHWSLDYYFYGEDYIELDTTADEIGIANAFKYLWESCMIRDNIKEIIGTINGHKVTIEKRIEEVK